MAPKRFLCFFNLKTGSEMIGFLCMIGTSLSIYGLAGCLNQIKIIFNTYTPDVKMFHLVKSFYTALHNPGEIIIALIIVQCVYLLSSIMLVIGLYKKNPWCMMPWIVFEPIRQLILLMFAVICTWVPFAIFNLDVSGKEIINFVPIAAAVVSLILTALTLHFWTIVNAVWDQIRENKKMEMFTDDQIIFNAEGKSAIRIPRRMPAEQLSIQ